MLPAPSIQGLYRTDARARAAYAEGAGIFRMIPAAVCVPAGTDDIVSLVRWAGAQGAALVPRGAGSGMGGGNVGEGVMVDLTGFPRRLEIDPGRRRALASASVTLAELNARAQDSGLRLPPDPSSAKWATVGGALSTNAAGARSVRYGSVRRWVEAIEMVTADAEVVELRRGTPNGKTPLVGCRALERFGLEADPAIKEAAHLVAARYPRTRKNSAGYALDAYLASGDVLDLVIGAEGTLGIVTAVEWRLDHQPSLQAGLRVTLSSLDVLAEAVAALLQHHPSAVELLDRSFLEVVGEHGAEAMLLVEIEGTDAETVRAAVDRCAQAVTPWATAVDTGLTPAAVERLWQLRHAASPILASLPEDRRSLQVIEDACVPVERMSEYVRTVREAAAERGLTVVIFGHAGDGHIHVNLLPEIGRSGWEEAVTGLLDEITDAVVRLGGTPSGEHGDGRLRAGLLPRVYGGEVVALFGRVKRAFDPLGIFNPGVILPCPSGPPGGEPPLSHLKVGCRAAPLPDDIARALRLIEQRGQYGRSRLDVADGPQPQP